MCLIKDTAQLVLTMDNGCGVLGDVSYFMPDGFGHSLPHHCARRFGAAKERLRPRLRQMQLLWPRTVKKNRGQSLCRMAIREAM